MLSSSPSDREDRGRQPDHADQFQRNSYPPFTHASNRRVTSVMKRETLIWTIVFVAGVAALVARSAVTGTGQVHVERSGLVWTAADADSVIAGTASFSLSRTAGTWVAAIFTLCIFSFLYRDNPFYKFAEAVVVGVSAAYWMVVAFWTTLVPNLFGKIWPALIQSWAMPGLSTVREDLWFLYLCPLVLGIMLLWRLMPSGAWISRWPLAFTIGAFAGLRMVSFIQADFLSQIRNSIVPLVVFSDGSFDFWASLKNIISVMSILACLVYFFFSFEHKGVVGKTAKVGIWILMITFGAAFGYTVMGRIALLAIRLEFLFHDWLGLV